MSNHFSAANLKSPGDDARLDLTDLFVFTAPDNPDRTVLIMDSNPFAKGNGVPPRRGLPVQHRQRRGFGSGCGVQLHVLRTERRSPNCDGFLRHRQRRPGRAEPRGELLIESTPVGFDAMATPVQAGPCRLFVGKRSDPFFADAEGVLHWLVAGQPGIFDWTGADTFGDDEHLLHRLGGTQLHARPWTGDRSMDHGQCAPGRHARADGPGGKSVVQPDPQPRRHQRRVQRHGPRR